MRTLRLRLQCCVVYLFLATSCLAATRHYYIAAEDVPWNYAPSGIDLLSATPIRQPWSLKLQWPKTCFIEYTDDTAAVQFRVVVQHRYCARQAANSREAGHPLRPAQRTFWAGSFSPIL